VRCEHDGVRSRAAIGWLIGVVAAGVAVGVGELVAVAFRPAAAPVIAVGDRLITLTPSSVRRNAIESVGTNDKPLLLAGIYLLLAVFGALIGELAMRRLAYGVAGVVALGAFGSYCALTADGSRTSDVVPTIVGSAVALAVLVALVLAASASLAAESAADAQASRPPGQPERRRFLQGTVAAAGLAAVAGFAGRAAADARFSAAGDRAQAALPGPEQQSASGVAGTTVMTPRGADLGKSGVPWATPNGDFYRIDTALEVPQLSRGQWQLRVHGMVKHPLTLTYDQLTSRPLVDHWVTLCCVSNTVGGNLISNALFRGALLADVLREAGISPDADELLMTSVDGMTIGAPAKVVMDGRPALLAVGMNGQPLPIEHGYPVRVVVPGLYGYVSACKWVVDIEATRFQDRRAFWVDQGWDAEPPIQLASRIDRPRSGSSVTAGTTVPIAGVAWDQHVGVSRVEVQIGDGPWQRARLASVPSTDTWRQWVLPWRPAKPGSYVLRVRAVDAKGHVQTDASHGPFPYGATGYHAVTVRVDT
jgi:DMSO/TMAO reductase YedYZ molybdopterin-dependent catalytic subunit